MKRKKRTVLVSWAVSYLLVFVAAIGAGVLISLYARDMVADQSLQVYTALVRQGGNDADAYMRDIYRIFEQVSLDTSVNRLLGNRTGKDHYAEYQAAKSLTAYYAPLKGVENIFVYDKNAGKIIARQGYLNTRVFYELYYADSGIGYEDFLDFLSRDQFQGSMVVRNDSGSLLFFASSIPFAGGGRSVNSCVVVNSSALDSLLESARWDESISFAVLDASGDTIIASGGAVIPALTERQLAEGDELNILDVEGGKLFIDRSAVSPWYTVVYVPRTLFAGALNSIGLVAFGVLLAGGGLCLVFAYYFINRNYRPLREVMGAFVDGYAPEGLPQGRVDEYGWLEETARGYRQRLGSTEAQLENHTRRMRNYLLFRLLEMPFDLSRDPRELRQLKLVFTRPYFVVLNFHFESSQALLLSSDLEKGRGALGFAIINVFTELMEPICQVLATDMGDRISVVANLPENNSVIIEKTRERVFQCRENLKAHLGVDVRCAMGAVHSGVEGIYSSSREAKEAGEYLAHDSRDTMVLYEEISVRQQAYQYPMELEQQIASTIASGSGQAAVNHIRQVLHVNRGLRGEMRRYLLLDLMSTVIKSANTVGQTGPLDKMDFAAFTAKGGEKELVVLAEEVCAAVRAQNGQSGQQPRLVRQVKEYVAANYSNPDLNVAHIGEHFNMTPAYLSGIFRDTTGLSLLGYINTYRVERAKERLARRENVCETSTAVGFRSSGAFIRVFKRVEGRTPGQWVSGTAG